MPYALNVAGGESAESAREIGRRENRRKKKRLTVDPGRPVSQREHCALGYDQRIVEFRIYSKFTMSSVEIARFSKRGTSPHSASATL